MITPFNAPRTTHRAGTRLAAPAPKPKRILELPLRVVAHNPHQIARLCMTLRIQRSQVKLMVSGHDLEGLKDKVVYLLPAWDDTRTLSANECAERYRMVNELERFRNCKLIQLSDNHVIGKVPLPL
jgi:hypothetical protein